MSLTSTKRLFLLLFLGTLNVCYASAQSHDVNKSVQIYAEVDATVPQIILHWDTVPNADNYVVYRKAPDDLSWGNPVNTFDGMTTIFLDEDVEPGQIYEYRITKVLNTGTLGYGYIYCGMEIDPVHNEGNMLLVIDSSYLPSIEEEMANYEETLRCSGWSPVRMYVDPSDEVMDVKNNIVELFEQDQYNITNILLVGHVPVPYSGNIAPDGHSNHIGAWPSDAFYGDMDGFWTDSSISNTSASSSRNHNVPGDGKFDQSVIASDIEVPIGRIDFSNLSVYTKSEAELINQYFRKNIDFRTKKFSPKMRGLIENNFSGYEEGFGQNGLKNFSTILGPDNYGYEDFDNAETASYLWVYGCGGGTYTSAGGISNSTNLANDSVQAVFTMLFGSYFGDWDSQNNFMRSALGSGTILSCSWSARPNWQYHPMGLGFNLGYCLLKSMNNPGFTYSPGFGNRQIHVALMGDPGLRMHVVAPPSTFVITESNGNASLSWESSPDTVAGYYIYRKTAESESYQLITEEYIESNSFIDSCLQLDQTYDYLVRAVQLIESPSGSFYGLSVGAKASQLISTDALPHANFDINVNLDMIELVNTSENAQNYSWDLGENGISTEENPGTFSELSAGEYTIILIAENACGMDTIVQSYIISSMTEMPLAQAKIFPNPADNMVYLNFENTIESGTLSLYSQNGKLYKQINFVQSNYVKIPISSLPNGSYIIQGTADGRFLRKLFQIAH